MIEFWSYKYIHCCYYLIPAIAKAPKFVGEVSDIVKFVGENVSIQTKLIAFPTPEISWFKDGVKIRSAPNIDFISEPEGRIGIK